MNGKKYRKIIITTVLFILGMIISKFNINLEGKIAEILQTIDNYSFWAAVILIIGFLCSITYKRKGRYIKILSELTLFAGAVVIAVRSLNGSIDWDFWSVCLYLSILLGEYSASIRKKCIDTKNCTLLRRAFFFFQRRDNNKICELLRKIFYFFNEKDIDKNGQIENNYVINHKPIKKYDQLYGNRKNQCDLVAKIIENEKIISDGYSICISGEWGSGKTSFIEALLDKLKSDNQKNEEKVEYPVIRINALELENINTLIEYYFKALKNILDEKGAYSGFKSEYKEMVNSFLKIASHDSIADYVTNKLYPQSDYRKSIEELDKLIKDVMQNERIIIVVDDIDRCSDKKATETMFFVKEIATRSNCISFFLVDYKKLKESKIINEFGDGFLEKFFNRVVAINIADYTEILKKFHDPGFEGNIYKVLDYYSKRIEDAKKKSTINKATGTETIGNEVSDAKNDLEKLKSQLSNPRKLIKAHEHYELLEGVVKEINEKVEKNEYDIYLKKIEYKKQLVLISLLYGFSPDLYTDFECEGYKKMISIEYNKNVIRKALINEWDQFGREKFNYEKRIFAEYIVSEPNKIIDIVNPYDSEFAEYTDYFDKEINLIDKGISFEQCIKVLFHNFGINGGEKYIDKAFDLYKSTLKFDDALCVFQLYKSSLIRDYPLISSFYAHFCNEEIKIDSPSKCQEIFRNTYQEILVNLLNSFTSYLYFLDDGQGRYDGLTMLTHEAHYCKTVEEGAVKVINEFGRVLEINFKSNDVVNIMNNIIEYVDQKGKKYDKDFRVYTEIEDIRNISLQAISEVEALMKIENYIFHKNIAFSDDRPSSILEKAKRFNKDFESEKGFYFMDDDFYIFITSLYNSEDEINDELLQVLDDTIKKTSKYNKYRAFKYRKFYMKLKKIKEEPKNQAKELDVSNENKESSELDVQTAESDSK